MPTQTDKITISVRLSPADLVLLDDYRGALSRSDGLRQLIRESSQTPATTTPVDDAQSTRRGIVAALTRWRSNGNGNASDRATVENENSRSG